MKELTSIKALLEAALSQINKYEEKPTKAESARIRATLGSIKKDVTGVRAALVAADKA
jgi:predicted lipoprotein